MSRVEPLAATQSWHKQQQLNKQQQLSLLAHLHSQDQDRKKAARQRPCGLAPESTLLSNAGCLANHPLAFRPFVSCRGHHHRSAETTEQSRAPGNAPKNVRLQKAGGGRSRQQIPATEPCCCCRTTLAPKQMPSGRAEWRVHNTPPHASTPNTPPPLPATNMTAGSSGSP